MSSACLWCWAGTEIKQEAGELSMRSVEFSCSGNVCDCRGSFAHEWKCHNETHAFPGIIYANKILNF